MSLIHVQQIRAHLTATFQPWIDMADCENQPQTQRDTQFLSRALAAFALTHVADLDATTAANCITDGSQDNGVDALHYDPAERVLYVVQSKWDQDGHGSLQRGEVKKFLTGIGDLINLRFERFNAKLRAREDDVRAAMESAQTTFVLIATYTGQEPLAEEPQRDFDDFVKEINDPTEVLQLRVLRQGEVHSAIVRGARGTPIDLEVVLRNWGHVVEPYLAYYGQVAIADVARWWEDHNPRLFAPNLRMFLGETEVNQGLLDTLRNAPDHFWYFNNGITALCGRISKKPVGGSSKDTGVFECTDVSIVNGAQTVGAIAAAYRSHGLQAQQATVSVRFISLERVPAGFSTEVTRATNTQNRIERRDFVSLDPEQARLRTELQLDGIEYVYKSGERVTTPAAGFDLLEATVALACSSSDLSFAVQAKREIGKLWEDISRPPYRALFNPSVTGRHLWTLVRLLRAIEEQLESERRLLTGRDAMLPVHGNRFLAHEVFQRLDLKGAAGADPAILVEAAKKLAASAVRQTLPPLNASYPESYLASLFKNRSKCGVVDRLLAKEWPPEANAPSKRPSLG
jgi:hypothetical protein